jgi:hypothetical protein
LRLRSDARWTPQRLAWLSVLLFWQEGASLSQRFAASWENLAALLGHQRRAGKSYQGWVKAWQRWSPRLLALLAVHLRKLVEAAARAGGCWTSDGWVLLGCDGTRINAPRTAENEKAFGLGGKKKTTPQLWLTTILHLGTGLPWAWKMGKACADERGHLRAMLGMLPAAALLIADAGYTGFDLWRQMLDGGQSFLIRVGANVRLLEKLGYAAREHQGIVYLWPTKKRRAGKAPMVLRLIRVRDGDKEMCLITNVLEAERLSDAQAASFYRRRWGLELWFRGMKRTLQQHKLRSATPVHAALELRWAVVSLLCRGLIQVRAIVHQGGDPMRAGLAECLKVVRTVMSQPQRRWRRGDGLTRRLATALRDGYVRKGSKAARDWPRPKQQRPPGSPRLRLASALEVRVAQQLPPRQLAA